MLGPGKSSQSRWTPFASHSTAHTRNPRHVLRVAWTRVEDANTSYATVGSTLVGSLDIIKGSDEDVVNNPDLFEYYDESEHALRLEYRRELQEPLGGMIHAIADVLLDNTSQRFTPNQNATIGTALNPNRPIKIDLGFFVQGKTMTVPNIRGLTVERVQEDKKYRRAKIKAYDFIARLDNSSLSAAIFENQRSDEIIESMLNDLGYGATQYELDTGLNTIDFAWFPSDMSVGKRIRKLCEAEEAVFYQDETGKLIFQNRRKLIESPYNTSQHTIHASDIMDWQEDDNAPIVNRCIVRARPRSIQSSAKVWEYPAIPLEIGKGASITVWARFTDERGEVLPVKTITTPVESTDYIANTASDGSGTDVSSDISLSVTNFVETAKVVVTNNSSGTAFLTTFQLQGEAAYANETIEEITEDSNSIDVYEPQKLVIENDFIQDQSFAAYLSTAMVRKYKDPRKRIRVTIPALPHLQIRDRITVEDPDLGTTADYRIMKIEGSYNPGEFLQTLTVRAITGLEVESPLVVGTSQVGGDDVVWI